MSPQTIRKAKEDRLEVRIKRDDKRLLEVAAALQGQSVTSYLLTHGLVAARQDRAQALILEAPARDRLVALLEKPPKANPALRTALKRAEELRA